MAMQIVRIDGESTGQHSAETIGAKASNLARMAALGLPVPPAFVLPIELGAAIICNENGARQALIEGLAEGVGFLEHATNKRMGDRRRPLLVSVRSSAAQSMPGMLDTVVQAADPVYQVQPPRPTCGATLATSAASTYGSAR
jgi:pyruvate,orthophosphate dikinase